VSWFSYDEISIDLQSTSHSDVAALQTLLQKFSESPGAKILRNLATRYLLSPSTYVLLYTTSIINEIVVLIFLEPLKLASRTRRPI